MFARLLQTVPNAVLAAAAGVWALGWAAAPAYAQCGCSQHAGGHAGHGAEPTAHQHGTPGDDHAGHARAADSARPAPPHGGQLTAADPLAFEVVYLPKEIRVYLYRRVPQAAPVKDVTGEVSLQRGNVGRATRVPLRHVAPAGGQQDYLSAPIDLGRVKDGEFTATVKLANLPLEDRPGITFAQRVVVSRAKPQVVLAALDQSDEAGVARQRVCPVTGAGLESMGGPVKVLVGDKPLYLCCKGCVGKVQSAPEAYLSKANRASR